MIRVGIRELRQNASKLIRRVIDGETIEVTERGRPVARIVPVHQSVLDEMIAEGRATAACGDLLELRPVPTGFSQASALRIADRLTG